MMTRRHFLAGPAAGLILNATGLIRSGSTQPGSKIAHMLIGYQAGSTSDIIARLLAHAMNGYAASIVVENRSGASRRVAIEALKSASPDGSVFILVPVPNMTLLSHIYKNLTYDLFEDFIPVTTVSSASEILTIGPKVPATVRTLADFVAWCRANPKDATYGSPGVGTPPHFIGAQLAQASGFEYTHVPYQGNGAATQDLLAGQIASAMLTIDSAPLVLSGKIRALATTGPQRSALLPDVPTFRESGYPMLERLDLWGIFLPAKTPLAIVEQLNNSVQEALKSDEVKAGLARSSIEPTAISLGEFARLVKADFESWGAVVKASGFTPQD